MACIEKIYSVSALVGNGKCNANCAFCAGKYLRGQAQLKDTNQDKYDRNFEAAVKLCARYGGWSLSLTSSGEVTCDPYALTHVLEIYRKCALQGAYFPNVNLFTNGILFGDEHFCRTFLPYWRSLGLNNVAISIHDVDEAKQAQVYGVKSYPDFKEIVHNLEKYRMGVRGTLLLRRSGVDSYSKYENAVKTLIDKKGISNITSWPVGNPDGTRSEFTPAVWNLWGIQLWLQLNAKKCHGHVWGGGVFDYQGNILRYTDYVTKHNPRKDFVRQLVVFQDGIVAYSWIRAGALCMK